MWERPSKRTEAEDTFRVDYLLECLRNLSHSDPSPTLRKRLSDLCSQRLQEKFAFSKKPQDRLRKSLTWLRPMLAAILLITIGLTAAFVGWHFNLLRAGNHARGNLSGAASSNRAHAMPVNPLSKSSLPEPRHARTQPLHDTGRRRMMVRLPYSNSAIRTGTGATIRVSISQSELLSLGFPVNATIHDRRIVAEVTLGDDGLPRAISVPLPPEVMKENK
jgi:hypothetical protein